MMKCPEVRYYSHKVWKRSEMVDMYAEWMSGLSLISKVYSFCLTCWPDTGSSMFENWQKEINPHSIHVHVSGTVC
jgi:hypothetical protein